MTVRNVKLRSALSKCDVRRPRGSKRPLVGQEKD
jgi:hypothetical protein